MDNHEWFESEDAQAKPSKVIKLPVKDYHLLNGMTSREMCEYCRAYTRLKVEDDEG